MPDVDAADRTVRGRQAGARRRAHRAGPVLWPSPMRCGSSSPSRTAGIRVAAASSSKNAKLFLERIRLDTFAAEQRLDYDFVARWDDAWQELFDADISGRDFPRGQARPDDLPDRGGGTRPLPEVTASSIEDATERRAGGQGGRDGRDRRGPPRRPATAGRRRRRPGRDDLGRRLPAGAASRVDWRNGRPPRRSGGDTPSGRRASGRWSTTASTPHGRGCARRCARWATGTS